MKKNILTIVVLLSTYLVTSAQLKTFQWTDYKGLLSKTNISMSIYTAENGQLIGNYCYAKYDKRIALKGEITGSDVVLYEIHDGKQTASFKGTLLTDSTDHLQGTWRDGKNILPFDVHLSGITSGSPTKRYNDTKVSDAMVEAYMKKVKTAILNKNKEWLSTQVNYPYKVDLANGKVKSLKNKQEFISNYNLVVSESLKKRIADICTCNLFMNYRGVMLGNGEVWINERPGGKGLFYISGLMP